MKQIKFPVSRNMPLRQLVRDALVEIERLDYSRRSRNRYRTTWDRLIKFSNRMDLGDGFSEDLVAQFLEEYRLDEDEMETPGEGWRRHIVWEISVLAEFAENGQIKRVFTELGTIPLVPSMQNVLREYPSGERQT